VSFGEGGTPVQNVEYRSSGVIFSISPKIRGENIELEVQQEISSFAETTTGLNGTPTLSRRSVTSSLSLKSGQAVVLGGLIQDNSSTSGKGLLGLPLGSSSSESTSEIIMVLQVQEVSADMMAVPAVRPITEDSMPIAQDLQNTIMESHQRAAEQAPSERTLFGRWSKCGLAGTFAGC
jgi:hypothetical protein